MLNNHLVIKVHPFQKVGFKVTHL
ncbi:hypothetical protein KSF78_0000055 [Schistosoma japonicum]|nr:hypothetical protein KSF78_0000055 [Schistosoma japonicum]KAH8849097.1 hypothetical protein KSF78_0000055 [Schistosoma japonicum]